ncbi:MAG: phosphate ABC transporter substrate-binding/OmpA family protein [Paracoccaceae bacterium]
MAAFVYLFVVAAAFAQDVTLTSRDGSVEITGTLLGYDGEFYRVDSIYGPLTLDGTGVLCSGPGCPDLSAFVADIRISGAATIGNRLLPALIEAFAEQQDYTVAKQLKDTSVVIYTLAETASGRVTARFSLHMSSSEEGFADLLADESDIAMSMREVTNAEVKLGANAGLGSFSSPRQNRVIALDALVPVVSLRNPVHQISPDDLAHIFAGMITNWNELGGVDAPVALHLRQPGSGVLQVFLDRIMNPSGQELATGIVRHTTNQLLLNAVAADPFAIGLSTLSENGGVRSLALVGGCGFRSAAVPEALRADDYPLTVPMFLYLSARRLPAVGREFLRFSRSPAAQIAILCAGFVDQTISRTPISLQGDRLANAIQAAGEEVQLDELKRLVSAMVDARRLSVTFRFEDGSSGLTAQSRSNVALLARALESGVIGAKELVFVGFSDGEGGAAANRQLSQERAKSVRAAVQREAATADPARVRLRVDGFGEAMPMACDDTEWGRQINRRVEVWAQ